MVHFGESSQLHVPKGPSHSYSLIFHRNPTNKFSESNPNFHWNPTRFTKKKHFSLIFYSKNSWGGPPLNHWGPVDGIGVGTTFTWQAVRSALEHIESIDDSRYGLDFKAGTVCCVCWSFRDV